MLETCWATYPAYNWFFLGIVENPTLKGKKKWRKISVCFGNWSVMFPFWSEISIQFDQYPSQRGNILVTWLSASHVMRLGLEIHWIESFGSKSKKILDDPHIASTYIACWSDYASVHRIEFDIGMTRTLTHLTHA